MDKEFLINSEKTKNIFQIPIHQKVEVILNSRKGSFPLVFSSNFDSNSALFNKYLKFVCEKAGLVDFVRGKLRSKKTRRLGDGDYPKYKIVTFHIL